MQPSFDNQYDLIKQWGIAKDAVNLNPFSQHIPIDNTIGTGAFERYNFDNTSLSRVQCQFKQTQQLTNENCQTSYVVYLTLQGSSQITLDKSKLNADLAQPKKINLISPSIWLMKGDLGRYSTTINANKEFKAFYIEFDDEFIATLTTQLQHRADFHSLVLAKLIATKGYLSLPIALNIHTESLIKQAWNLFNTRSPTDEMSFMALKGQTLLFTSKLLMHSFHKLAAPYENELTPAYLNHAYQAKLLLDQYYYQNWTIRDLAKKAGTNECYLKTQFKQLTQCTIGEYRTQKRLQVARQLLAQGSSIAQVANQTGFNSTDYFVRVFKKHYGCHPIQTLDIQLN